MPGNFTPQQVVDPEGLTAHSQSLAKSDPSSATPPMLPRYLTALPVYNEKSHVISVLSKVKKYATDILVVDDGSTDGTSQILAQCSGIDVVRHPTNTGYGAALRSAFQYAIDHQYEILLTIDCDGQHEPQRIVPFVEACQATTITDQKPIDIVSGSRYLSVDGSAQPPPESRRRINAQITQELNEELGLQLTDAFCGFKAYRVDSLRSLHLSEEGYAMPLELWVQAARHNFKIVEVPVPLIYLDEERSFGGALDDASTRLGHYRDVIRRAQQMSKSSHLDSSRISPDSSRSNRQPSPSDFLEHSPQTSGPQPSGVDRAVSHKRPPSPTESVRNTSTDCLSSGCGPCT